MLACDFFTVETLALRTVYVLFFIDIGTRRVHYAGCTAHPDGQWVAQQACQVVWGLPEREHRLRSVLHDHDSKFTGVCDDVFVSKGIADWYWATDPQGVTRGGWGLWLRPQDMAKFGYLYLHGGNWDGQQVVSSDWVADSWSPQIAAGRNWLSDNYGYQWWIDREGYFMALGYGGQYIVIVPERNLIVVATSGLRLQDFAVPETLLTHYVLPAAESSEPLPANPEGVAALEEQIAILAESDAAHPVPSLPEIALQVSGKPYDLEPGGVGWLSLRLDFTAGENTATLTVDGEAFAVGLDGTFRSTERQVPPDTYWQLRGGWRDANTFAIDIVLVGRPERYTEILDFEGDGLTMRETEYVTSAVYTTTGRIAE